MNKHDQFEKFFKNMLIVRSSKGLSQRESSKMADLKNLSRWETLESGRGTPTIFEIISICKLLDQPIDSMLNKECKVTIEFT